MVDTVVVNLADVLDGGLLMRPAVLGSRPAASPAPPPKREVSAAPRSEELARTPEHVAEAIREAKRAAKNCPRLTARASASREQRGHVVVRLQRLAAQPRVVELREVSGGSAQGANTPALVGPNPRMDRRASDATRCDGNPNP